MSFFAEDQSNRPFRRKSVEDRPGDLLQEMAGSSPAMTSFWSVIAGLDPVISARDVPSTSSFRRKPESSFILNLPKLDPGLRRGDEREGMAGSGPAMTF
jgi:hypothetical protein